MPIIISPTISDVHVNRPLTNFSQMVVQGTSGFISTVALPILPVRKDSDVYWVYNSDDFHRNVALERAPGTQAVVAGYRLSTDSYKTKRFAVAHDISDLERANQDSESGISLDEDATMAVTRWVLVRREEKFFEAYMNTVASPWFNGTDAPVLAGDDRSAVENKWNGTQANPIITVHEAMDKVHRKTGYRPNKMILARDTFTALSHNPLVLGRIIGGATSRDPALGTVDLLAREFGVSRIFISDAVRNDAIEGVEAEMDFFTSGTALLYYAPDSVGLKTPTAGVQFVWTGLTGSTPNGIQIKRYRMDPTWESDRVEANSAFDFKVTAPSMGYLFTKVLG